MSLCKEDTFKSVFSEWQKPLQHFVQSNGFDKAPAADITQEAFVNLWKKCSEVRLESVKPYLYKICKNLMINEHRSFKVRLKYKENLKQNAFAKDGQYELEVKEFKHKMELTLEQMPEKQRAVFLMHRMGDMSYAEIAEHLGLSKKAIEKRMSQALLFLANKNILKKK